jgi:hypothetical protein
MDDRAPIDVLQMAFLATGGEPNGGDVDLLATFSA